MARASCSAFNPNEDSGAEDAEIYPDETAQRVGSQDPYYVASWKGRRKENTHYTGFADTRISTGQNIQWTKFRASSKQNARKAGYAQKTVSEVTLMLALLGKEKKQIHFLGRVGCTCWTVIAVVTKEFRVVRDNRSSKSTDKIIKPGSPQNSHNSNLQDFVPALDKRLAYVCFYLDPWQQVPASMSLASLFASSVKLNATKMKDALASYFKLFVVAFLVILSFLVTGVIDGGCSFKYLLLLEEDTREMQLLRLKCTTSRNFVGQNLPPVVERRIESRQGHTTLESRVNDGELTQKLNSASISSALVGGVVENKKEVHSSILASANMTIGLYSSSSDPVHVPSADTRSAGTIGAARRPVGVVGSQRHPWNHSAVRPSIDGVPFSVHLPGKDLSSTTKSFGDTVITPKTNNFNRNPVSEPIISSTSVSRALNTDRPNIRSNQQVLVHQKAIQSNMEWRPKSSQNSRITSPDSHQSRSSSDSVKMEAADLSGRFSEVSISDGVHVIIPKHLRVPDADLTHLVFGSFGDGPDSVNIGSVAPHECNVGPVSSDKSSVRILLPVPLGSLENDFVAGTVDRLKDNVTTSLANSSPSTTESGQALPSSSDFPSPKNIHCFEDIGTDYHHQTADCTPFSKAVIESNPQQTLLLEPKRLGLNMAGGDHQSTATIIQQQHRPTYPQTHIQQYTNFVPYRQVMSQIYAPPMTMPNCSGNPAYLHAQSGSSYLFMPGGNSHVTAGGFKYSTPQYKALPAGSYTFPPGYTIGTLTPNGSIANVEDAARFKFMENGLYVPNVQVDSSDILLQTQREASMHSSPYDLLDQSAAAQAAYLSNYSGHVPFNGVAHSSPLQYPSGFYHPSLQGSITGPPPHLVHPQLPLTAAGAVAASPGVQLGTFQQPQLGHHLGWPANF
ncbi:hypothetical protein AXF42_Ash006824 [Apostasia shenzhenica]|uniref:Uncharacterized protein n=1 Tax=Apostasia shenzhenica TaxID=1088818 RepID=A0A2I0AJ85_9ASPA|nr:hypothetical protein AXF42_Ash006824 [Apostasia shenzhenica]